VIRPRQHRFGADDVGLDTRGLVQDSGHRDLAERHQRGSLRLVAGGLGALGVPSVHRHQCVDPGDLLANVGVAKPPRRAGHFD
jgi:hypothetical protein